MTTKDVVSNFSKVLEMAKDISVNPKISSKKLSNAIKKYGTSTTKPDEILLLIDNTITGSGKQGLFITENYLFAFTEISGKFSIKLNEVVTISPQVKKALGIPIIGIMVNNDYFISLPGLGEELKEGENSVIAILLLCLFLVEVCGCELVPEDEGGNTRLPNKEKKREKTTAREEVSLTEFPSRAKTKSNYRICKKCGLPFTPSSFGERAKFGILGNIVLPGLGFYFRHKMKKYCPFCR